MAQLIKLSDYISRYEMDVYRYPSQFIRLKKQQWQRVFDAWEEKSFDSVMKDMSELRGEPEHIEKESIISKFKNKFIKNKEEVQSIDISPLVEVKDKKEDEFLVEFTTVPKSLDELKYLFLDDIFRFQIRWASSTLLEKSVVDNIFYRDPVLKHFLQSLPDHFLFMYKPVFKLKNAPIEMDMLLIGPTEVYCIVLIERAADSVYTGSKEKFWIEKGKDFEKKILNPLISLNRTGSVVQKLFESNGVEMPVRKIVLSRNGYIDYPFSPHDVLLLDKRSYDNWFQKMRQSSSPLKHIQLKATQILLSHCLSNSYKRAEWTREME